MNFDAVKACQEYAKLLCAKRALEKAERILIELVPEEARETIDTIKKIMEIDTKVVDPKVVLMRASVINEPRTSYGDYDEEGEE